MRERTSILFSAYRFDPSGVSEAYSGFKWAEMLSNHFALTVCTPEFNRASIEAFLQDHPESSLASAEFMYVEMGPLDARLGSIGSALKPGFFVYENRLLRRLRRLDLGGYGVVMHRTPVSFRFRTRLGSLGLPLVVGPISGGLHPPEELKEFFGAEPLLYKLRGLDGALLGWDWWIRPLKRAAVVLISSEYLREILPVAAMNATEVITETGVDCAALSPRGERASEAGPLNVVFAGRLTRYKAPTLAVRAFASFLASTPAAAGSRLVMVGDGEDAQACREVARDSGIEHSVEFTGWVPKSVALERMAEGDVFLFPSLTEAAGNVYLEAMAMGLPSVIVNSGGGRDLVPETAAFKVPVSGPDELVEALAQGLVTLSENPGLRRQMGDSARSYACEHYDWPALELRATALIDRVAVRS